MSTIHPNKVHCCHGDIGDGMLNKVMNSVLVRISSDDIGKVSSALQVHGIIVVPRVVTH